MKEIVKVLLAEGIDEEIIHEVLSVIEENYEITDEGFLDKAKEFGNKVADKVTDAVTNSNNPIVDKLRKTSLVANTVGKRAYKRNYERYQQARADHSNAVSAARGKGIAQMLINTVNDRDIHNPEDIKKDIRNKVANVKQARKASHDTADKYGLKFSDPNYQKIHNEYQKTHDSKGNEIK